MKPLKLSTLILEMLDAHAAYLKALDNHEGDDVNARLLYEDFRRTLEELDAWRPE